MPGIPVLHHLLETAQTHVHGFDDAMQPSMYFTAKINAINKYAKTECMPSKTIFEYPVCYAPWYSSHVKQ